MKLFIAFLMCLTLQLAKPGIDSDIKLSEHLLIDQQLSILIPDSFKQMSEDMLKLKYPSQQRPTMVYTNETGSVNVTINHTQNRISHDELPEVKDYQTSVFKNSYPSATWYRNEIIEKGGAKFILFDIRTPAIDTEVRNIILVTSFQGRLLLISFNCTKELETKWLPLGNQIIDSVQVKKHKL